MSGKTDLQARLYVRQPLSGIESTLFSRLAEEGTNIFTIRDVEEKLDKPYNNAKAIVNRLVKKRWAVRLTGGKYLVVPFEAGVRAEYSEHEFIIASHLAEPYYVGYWSALNYHGLTEQVPRTVFVATPSRVGKRKILDSDYRFITLAERKFFGYDQEIIGDARVNVSDREKTLVDCLDHPEYCGGLEEVVKALHSGRDELSLEKMAGYAKRMGNSAILKRLGYLIELMGIKHSAGLIDSALEEVKKGYVLLDPTEERGGWYLARWRLRVNVSDDRLREWKGRE